MSAIKQTGFHLQRGVESVHENFNFGESPAGMDFAFWRLTRLLMIWNVLRFGSESFDIIIILLTAQAAQLCGWILPRQRRLNVKASLRHY